ncbi:MAG: hypothetical protein IT384_24875 [Deltaproteobacteria bacterium]|nr:hypothetical protein [Deltaproteobacteria bacterium]
MSSLLLALALAACATDPVDVADSGGATADARPDAGGSARDAEADAGVPADGSPRADAAPFEDAGALDDASTPNDGAVVTDGGVEPDAATAGDSGSAPDAATPLDASTADGGACHPRGFGSPAVPLTSVANLPAMTGGTIPLGTYDVVGAYTTGSLSGTIRGTWAFVSATELEAIDQVVLQGAPPPTEAKTFSYTAAGTSLSRALVCGSGPPTFNNEYTARTAGSDVFFDIRNGSLMFTFQRRP